MATEFGMGKTIFILAIVVGCFAVLWPKIFYPMLQSSVSIKPNIVPTTDCCDVIFEKDLNAIKIMTQLCEKILSSQTDFDKRLLLSFQQGKLTKEIVNKCNSEVHDKCNVDIREFLMEKVRLGRTYQQMLSELRTLNSSFCLKTNFGISPGLIGAPRRMRVWETKHLRQERPPHLRPHMIHPALREKGRAIPHSHIVPRVLEKDAPVNPMPGMRPPMGGAGHVVPAPKGSSTMGIVMPLYTIGIVIFFMYTMMKLIFKKTDDGSGYKDFEPDPEFRRVVFSDAEHIRQKTKKDIHFEENNTKLVVSAISGLVAEVNRDILSKQESAGGPAEEAPPELAVEKEEAGEEDDTEQVEEKVEVKNGGGGAVQVVGMEMTESVEGGQKWSRPATPLTPRSATPIIPIPEPQSIYLEGSLPSQSQLLVSQSEIEKLTQGSDESPVILAGKVTLSLIGLDDTLKTDNGGPEISSISSNEVSEEEEEDGEGVGGIVEQVSEDEAEAVDKNFGINGDEDLTTHYTTASAAGGIGDETAADFSIMEPHHDEEEEGDEEELEEDIEVLPVALDVKVPPEDHHNVVKLPIETERFQKELEKETKKIIELEKDLEEEKSNFYTSVQPNQPSASVDEIKPVNDLEINKEERHKENIDKNEEKIDKKDIEVQIDKLLIAAVEDIKVKEAVKMENEAENFLIEPEISSKKSGKQDVTNQHGTLGGTFDEQRRVKENKKDEELEDDEEVEEDGVEEDDVEKYEEEEGLEDVIIKSETSYKPLVKDGIIKHEALTEGIVEKTKQDDIDLDKKNEDDEEEEEEEEEELEDVIIKSEISSKPIVKEGIIKHEPSPEGIVGKTKQEDIDLDQENEDVEEEEEEKEEEEEPEEVVIKPETSSKLSVEEVPEGTVGKTKQEDIDLDQENEDVEEEEEEEEEEEPEEVVMKPETSSKLSVKEDPEVQKKTLPESSTKAPTQDIKNQEEVDEEDGEEEEEEEEEEEVGRPQSLQHQHER